MRKYDDFNSITTKEFLEFFEEETHQQPCPINRAPVQGWVRIAFWVLRLYILVMLVTVAVGFSRGIH